MKRSLSACAVWQASETGYSLSRAQQGLSGQAHYVTRMLTSRRQREDYLPRSVPARAGPTRPGKCRWTSDWGRAAEARCGLARGARRRRPTGRSLCVHHPRTGVAQANSLLCNQLGIVCSDPLRSYFSGARLMLFQAGLGKTNAAARISRSQLASGRG